jgi:hypothetical protein
MLIGFESQSAALETGTGYFRLCCSNLTLSEAKSHCYPVLKQQLQIFWKRCCETLTALEVFPCFRCVACTFQNFLP